MKDYGIFAATKTRPLPAGWVIPRGDRHEPPHGRRARSPAVAWHRDRDHRLADTQMDVDRFVISAISPAPRLSQGRQEARISGTLERASLPRRYRLDLRSPPTSALARLAFYLLEADSDDGLATWNVIGEGLSVGAGVSGLPAALALRQFATFPEARAVHRLTCSMFLHRCCAGCRAVGVSSASGAAEAQESINYASVSGRVTDPQGAVVAGATVTARQIETAVSAADHHGRLRQVSVPLPARGPVRTLGYAGWLRAGHPSPGAERLARPSTSPSSSPSRA